MVKPVTNANNANLISLTFFINVLAQIHTKSIVTNTINPAPSLPSVPHILLLKSLEKIVDNSKDTNIAKIPPSSTLFKNVTFPSQIHLIISKLIMIVDSPRITRDILLSVQSQGKGIIARGTMNRIKKNRYF
jgi:hypothetical protein